MLRAPVVKPVPDPNSVWYNSVTRAGTDVLRSSVYGSFGRSGSLSVCSSFDLEEWMYSAEWLSWQNDG
jgi:hypothetical protein